ncbi:hypothetical protein ADN00_03405 [Ornatilinea apprima]|uniref:DUF4013 domain-containing protein n=1 Tax=Ornatilinea apprima TaxID=1134406 RepID=A0A0P6XGT6_9CHLR|nr:DUF4013 domain-containing protein [Ornatilinea apprima]KPL78956.1 hypothetical protein ADN00_03405 [Ornatilinea apprima]
MEFGLPFTYAFQDSDWFKKIALAGAVSLIPIIGQIFLLGWGLEIARRVINNDPNPLPDLDFGNQLGLGFKAWVVSLVYAIPMFILTIPSSLISAFAGSNGDDTMLTVMAVLSICTGLVSVIYGLLMGFVLPAAYGRVAMTNTIGAGLKFGEVFAMVKKAPMAFLIALLGSIVAGLIAPLGLIACVVGVVVTGAFSVAVLGHFYGQAYKQAM